MAVSGQGHNVVAFFVTARPRIEVRMLVQALKPQLTRPATLVGSLTALVTQKWAANVVHGQIVLSTSEAGSSVTFTFERAHTPTEPAVMAEEALEWGNTLADLENPQIGGPVLRPRLPTNRSGSPPVSQGTQALPPVGGGGRGCGGD